MKKALKWIGIAAAIVVAMVIIAQAVLYIYMPESREGWVKPGVPQDEIPAGVDTAVVFENVTVLPMDSERVLEGQTVVIADQSIADIGASGDVDVPAGAHVVDGTGRFLMPGLSDMHVHVFGTENDLFVYLANGVTTIRTMGGDPPAILEWRDQIRAGTRVGPSIWAWNPMFENQDEDWAWGTERATRGGKTFVDTPEEAEQLVAEMAVLGVDGIKSHYVLSQEIFQAFVESADQHGLPLDGHAPSTHANCPINPADKPICVCARGDCWDDFRAMGVPALAHVEELIKLVALSDESLRVVSDEGIRQIAQDAADDGLWVTSTIYMFRSIVDQAADLEGMLAALPETQYVHPDVFENMGWGAGYYVDLGSRPYYPNYLASQEQMLLALNESGALLMSGTDAPSSGMVPGFSLHDELVTMADVGLSPFEVLKTSTTNPALYLGELDEVGTVEVGKRADLVLLEENPLDDVTNTRQIAGVMARGRYFDRTDLDSILEAVSQNYEAAETTGTVLEIAFPIVVVLLLVALVWFIVRRRKASQTSS
jgi:imidazolonepropionase-like amidohydrolase